MIYTISNEYLEVKVKSFGAELTSIKSKETGIEYLWQGDPNIWAGQSPILFPIIGRVLNDKYYLNSIEYSMMKHGFFRRREANLVAQNEAKITFIEKDDAETLKIYPYSFEVYVAYELVGKSVKSSYRVVNKNNNIMYFSIGGHPAFNCSIGDKIVFDNNETLDTIGLDTECLRNGKTYPVLNNENTIIITKDIFNNDALIFNNVTSKNVTIESDNHNRKVRFDMGECPYLGIWAKPNAPYVCLEPWWGVDDDYIPRDDFSKKDCIQSLGAGKEFNCYWQVEIIE